MLILDADHTLNVNLESSKKDIAKIILFLIHGLIFVTSHRTLFVVVVMKHLKNAERTLLKITTEYHLVEH